TGLWQVSGRNEISFDERVKMECAYVDNLSIFRDFLILVRTIFVVLK
ncbi:MAG: sugar transferase, partial [Campylobacter sp.]